VRGIENLCLFMSTFDSLVMVSEVLPSLAGAGLINFNDNYLILYEEEILFSGFFLFQCIHVKLLQLRSP